MLSLPRLDRAATTRVAVAVLTAAVPGVATIAQFAVERAPTDLLDLSAAPFDPTVLPDRNVADTVASASGDVDATDRLLDRLTPAVVDDLPRVAFEEVAAELDDDEVTIEGVIERSTGLMVVLVRTTAGRLVVSVATTPDDPASIEGVFITPLPPLARNPITDAGFILLLGTVVLLVAVGLFPPSGGSWYVAAGLVASAATAELTPWPATQSLALLAVPAALVVALVAAAGRLPPPQVLLVVTIAAATSVAPYLAVAPGAVDAPYGHLVTVGALQGHVRLLQRGAAGAACVAALTVLAWLTVGSGRAVGRGRRGPAWRIGGARIACLVLVGLGVAGLVSPAALDLTASGWSVTALLAVGAGRAAQLLRRHIDLADVNARVADLGSADDGDLGTVIGRALDDPTAHLLYARPGGFVDTAGRAATLPADPRSVTLLSVDGETVGALVHDPGVGSDPDRLRATCDAVKLSLANERLTAEIRWRLEEVRASRHRLVQAEEQARSRIERDLHDGAQQRLTAATLQLRIVQHAAAADGSALAWRIEPIIDELQRATDEIRELARGVRPSALDGGLAAAADDLAERAPLPVSVRDRLTVRPAPEIEAVAWFVLNEAVTNASRHAGAGHVGIDLVSDGCQLRVVVTDDGCGIDPAHTVLAGERPTIRAGTGLVGLFDRVDANGGTLSVHRADGAGTIVEVRLPCEP